MFRDGCDTDGFLDKEKYDRKLTVWQNPLTSLASYNILEKIKT